MAKKSDRKPKYRRVLLKLSGEALMGPQEFGLDTDTTDQIAEQIRTVNSMGVEVSIVIGGGNIFRGISLASSGIERASADYMGMLATVMNALALQSILERKDLQTRVLSAIPMATICEPYIRRRAIRHMEMRGIMHTLAGIRLPDHPRGPRAPRNVRPNASTFAFSWTFFASTSTCGVAHSAESRLLLAAVCEHEHIAMLRNIASRTWLPAFPLCSGPAGAIECEPAAGRLRARAHGPRCACRLPERRLRARARMCSR